jgi:hypothetical protein
MDDDETTTTTEEYILDPTSDNKRYHHHDELARVLETVKNPKLADSDRLVNSNHAASVASVNKTQPDNNTVSSIN